jgi:hypothetical protein
MEMHLPESVPKVAVLTTIQYKLLEKNMKKAPKSYSYKQVIPSKSDSKPPISPGDLWKARQLREHRRANGLCFKCGDKFAPGHKCLDHPPEGTLAQLVAQQAMGDGGGIISEELLEAMEILVL